MYHIYIATKRKISLVHLTGLSVCKMSSTESNRQKAQERPISSPLHSHAPLLLHLLCVLPFEAFCSDSTTWKLQTLVTSLVASKG